MRTIGIIIFLLFATAFSLMIFKQKIGDVRPAFLPVQKIIQQNDGKKLISELPLTLPEGFAITYFSKDTPGVRDAQFSPEGTLLVSQPSQGKIVALPDKNNDGRSDETKAILEGLKRPHGLAFLKDKLFVAEETRVTRYRWNEQNLTATFDKKLFDLPSGGRHFSRTIAIEKDGTMYVTLGSTCDTCFEKHPFIGAVIISTTEGKKPEVFAKGLRNSVFIKLDSQEKLWGTEMGRDFLGDNLPPDEVNVIRGPSTGSGQNPIPDFGWPVCYGNRVYDQKFGQRDASYCNNTVAPIFNLPAHVAPLGLTFIHSSQFPKDWQGDLLVGLHGSWNSSVPVGYKIVRLKIRDSKVVGMEDFISGFISDGQVIGRPVDVEFGPDLPRRQAGGALYVTDDKAGAVYRVAKN